MPPKNYEMPPEVNITKKYLASLRQFEILKKEDEYRLWEEMQPWKEIRESISDEQLQDLPVEQQAIKSQYDEAFETLFNHNLRLVVSVAKKFSRGFRGNSTIELLDLVQDGNLGLHTAVDRFDARRGFKFSTYATWWINQSINRGIADKKTTIRTPVHVEEVLRQLAKAEQESSHIDDPKEREEYICELTGFSPEKIKKLKTIKTTIGTLSLNNVVTIGKDGDGNELGELLPDNATTKEIDDFTNSELLKDLLSCSGLTDRERRVIECRFGLSDGEVSTLLKIGEELGVTRERVRQIEARALDKLRKKAKNLSLSY